MLPLITFVVAAALAQSTPAEAKLSTPGARVPDFSLDDIHRRPRSLESFKDKKAFVVLFVDTECPLANLYVPTEIALHRKYATQGVQFLAINSSRQDSFVQVSAHAQEREIPFPVLKDFDQKVADAWGAERTPEAFLLDADGVIRYHGRIDDQYGVGFRRDKPAHSDLAQALDEFLAGKPITTAYTESPGCAIERSRKPDVRKEVTYAKNVAPVLQKRCQECHRPGEIGPFSLLTFDDARNAQPGSAKPSSKSECPRGTPTRALATSRTIAALARKSATRSWRGSTTAHPREMTPTYRPQSSSPRAGRSASRTRSLRWPTNSRCRPPACSTTRDSSSIPGSRMTFGSRRPSADRAIAVVHHILVYILAPGRRDPYDQDGTAATLVGWAPGDMPANYSPDTARLVPAGAKLLFEVHYTPNGTEQSDRSSVGIRLAEKPPAHSVEMNILANMFFRIPPRSPNYKGQMTFTFPDDALVLSFMPHMHLRGTSARYELTRPDGSTETLLSVPDYDFGWQSVYRFAKPLQVPKGSKLTWIGRWDNSPDNPRNPDPAKSVRWGLQTWDEMQNGWMELVWQKSKS